MRASVRHFVVSLLSVAVAAPFVFEGGSSPVEAAGAAFLPLPAPQRVLDTRPAGPTADGQQSGIGMRADLQTTVLPIAGRVGVAGDAASVVLNVTVTEPETNGYVTVFPCDAPRPTASNLNFTVGQTIPNTVITKLAGDGTVCLFTFGRTHLVVDVAGAFASDAFLPFPAPQRIADTRAGYPTADGRFSGTGALTTGGTLAVEVGGRAGIPPGGSTVVLNVTVTEPESAGFVTVYPCNAPLPDRLQPQLHAWSDDPQRGGHRPRPERRGVHLHTRHHASRDRRRGTARSNGVHGVVRSAACARQPTRLSHGRRPDVGHGTPAAGSIAATADRRTGWCSPRRQCRHPQRDFDRGGHERVRHRPPLRGTPRPTTSNLNYVAGQTIPNAVITALGPNGEACLYTHGATHLVVDVAGYITGPPPATTGPDCPHTTPSASTDEVRNTLLQYPTIYPALGEDRIAVWLCVAPPDSIAYPPQLAQVDNDVNAVATWLQATVRPYFVDASCTWSLRAELHRRRHRGQYLSATESPISCAANVTRYAGRVHQHPRHRQPQLRRWTGDGRRARPH